MAENSVYRIGFVIEQVLGHITHGQNLQANVRSDVEIEDYWSFPVWDATGLAGMMPNWTLKAGLQARHDIQSIQHQTTLDALFFHTYITALLSQNWLKRIPSVISLDATPRQYDELGQSYQHESGPDWLEQQKWRLNRNAFRAARHLVS
ncbi:MAG: glycosyltransferase family 1 protein, partial [Anaerolineales bacterium]